MSLTITQVNLPQSQYNIKCPFAMNPTGITMHNTANDASAMAEVSFMQGNPYEISYHYAVDDTRAVQGLPLDRNGWHAGDGGKGTGNRNTIGVEICYSKSGGSSFTKAEKNAAELVARILKSKGWGINKVGKHQDYWQGTYYKYCPHRTLDLGWQRFLNMVQAELNKLNGSNTSTSKPATKTFDVGDKVKVVDALYKDAAGSGRSTISRGKTGTIQKLAKSGKKYHVVGTGFSGWAHENDIELVKDAATKPTLPAGFIKEEATFVNGNSPITTRTNGAGLKYNIGKQLKAGESVEYLGVTVADGYTWIYTKDKRYIPVRPVGKEAWGKFE